MKVIALNGRGAAKQYPARSRRMLTLSRHGAVIAANQKLVDRGAVGDRAGLPRGQVSTSLFALGSVATVRSGPAGWWE